MICYVGDVDVVYCVYLYCGCVVVLLVEVLCDLLCVCIEEEGEF